MRCLIGHPLMTWTRNGGDRDERAAIRARLEQAGSDVAAAEAAGAFVALDALETALRCVVADWPDPADTAHA